MVSFTTTEAADFTMMATFEADRYTDVTDAAGETIASVNGADLSAIIFDDSTAMETYEAAELVADENFVAPVYTDGYAMTIMAEMNSEELEVYTYGVCVTGSSPVVGDDAAMPFTSCVVLNGSDASETSYTTEAAAADSDNLTTDYDAVVEVDNIGYNASWTFTGEDTTDAYMGSHSPPYTQTTAIFSRFLPSLGDDGEYSASDVRFDADTTTGKICFYEDLNSSSATFSCLATLDAEGEALWAGAATICAGAAVAIAATLF
jgi:hypothetical protein